jgi:hypothetical protein
MKAVILLALFTLSACGTPPVRIALPPVELTTCADEPATPDIPARDGTDATQIQRDTLTLSYILGLRSAYGDCKAKVAGLKAWSEAVE